MKSRWSDREVDRIAVSAPSPAGEDLRQRIYSARLLGAEPELVLHGGGNVSLKTSVENVFGVEAPAVRWRQKPPDRRH